MISLRGNLYLIDLSAFRDFGLYPFLFDIGEHTVIVARQTLREMRQREREVQNYARVLNYLDSNWGIDTSLPYLLSTEAARKTFTLDDITIELFDGSFRRAANSYAGMGLARELTIVCSTRRGGAPELSQVAFASPVRPLHPPEPWDGYIIYEPDAKELADPGMADVFCIWAEAEVIARGDYGVIASNYRVVIDPARCPALKRLTDSADFDYFDYLRGGRVDEDYFCGVVCDLMRDDMALDVSIGCHDEASYQRYRRVVFEEDRVTFALAPTGLYDSAAVSVWPNQACSFLHHNGLVDDSSGEYNFDEKLYDELDELPMCSTIVFENCEAYSYQVIEALDEASYNTAAKAVFLYHTPVDDTVLPIQSFNRDRAIGVDFSVIDDRALGSKTAS